MKYLILPLLIIVAVEWNVQWLDNENAPNIFRAWDEKGQEVNATSTYEKVEGVWGWTATVGGEKFWISLWQE